MKLYQPYRLLISMTEAERRASVSRHVLYKAIRDGDLPAVKIGKQFRVRPEDVDALVRPVVPGQS